MPITKKSNIRSRWYRANEKPLDSGASSYVSEPVGEISINKNEKLIDDLSSVKPPPPKQKKENIKPNHSSYNQDRNNSERKPKKERGFRSNDNARSKNSKSRNHRNRNNQQRDYPKDKAERRNSKGNPKASIGKKHSEKTISQSKDKETQSKLGSFIAKIFGK